MMHQDAVTKLRHSIAHYRAGILALDAGRDQPADALDRADVVADDADALCDELCAAAKAAAAAPPPVVVTFSDGAQYATLTCPVCKGGSFALCDTSVRQNPIAMRRRTATGALVVQVVQAQSDPQTDGYVCRDCGTAVTLPDVDEVVW
jgi:hypothetical protein